MLSERPSGIRAAPAYAVGLATLLALLFLSVAGRFDSTVRDESSTVFVAATAGVALCIISLPFVLTWQHTRSLRFDYRDLFHYAWTSPHIVVGAVAFVGATWLVLLLWASLFDIIGIKFFSKLFFDDHWFAPAVTATAMGVAIATLREWEQAVGAVRGGILALFRILNPIVTVIVVLFLASLPFTGLDPLWSTRAATPILLSTAAVAILVLNAAVDDSEERAGKDRVLKLASLVLAVLLPIFAVLAWVALSLRIRQHGLTPDRAYLAVVIAIATLYGFSYAGAVVLRPRTWRVAVRQINVAMAVAMALIAIAVNTPLLDFQRMSANDQVARLMSGAVKASDFDFGLLRFELGRAGKEGLESLRAASTHPEHAAIVEGVVRAKTAPNRWTARNPDATFDALESALTTGKIRVLPPGTLVPDGFKASLIQRLPAVARSCVTESVVPWCYFVVADLSGDNRPEVALLHRRGDYGYLFSIGAEGWSQRVIETSRARGAADGFAQALGDGQVGVVTRSVRALKVGQVDLWMPAGD